MGWSKNYYCLSIKLRIRLSFGNPSIIYGWNFSDWMYNIVVIRRITTIRDLFSVISLQLLSGVTNTYLFIYLFYPLCGTRGKSDASMYVVVVTSLRSLDQQRAAKAKKSYASLFGCVCTGIAQIWRDCTLFGLFVGLIVDTIFTSTKIQDKFFSSRRPNLLILIFDLRRTQLYFSWRCYKKFDQRIVAQFFIDVIHLDDPKVICFTNY